MENEIQVTVEKFEERDGAKRDSFYYVWTYHAKYGDGFENDILPLIVGKFPEFKKLFESCGGHVILTGKYPEFVFHNKKSAEKFASGYRKMLSDVNFDLFAKELNDYDGRIASLSDQNRSMLKAFYIQFPETGE